MFSKRALLIGIGVLSTCAGLLPPGPAIARDFLSLQEALDHAFPRSRGCMTRTESHHLTAPQLRRARELARVPVSSAPAVRYVGYCHSRPVGYAYLDTHPVRSRPETLFFIVNLRGQIQKVQVLSFDEPLEHMPRPSWYDAFRNSRLGPELQLRRRIPWVTNAPVTGRATVDAARRVLALDEVIKEALTRSFAPPLPRPRPTQRTLKPRR